jgi:hypothetical protein
MDELTARATANYLRDTPGGSQPNSYSGVQDVRDRTYVVLRNNLAGVLAVYRIRQDPGKSNPYLRRLRRWPRELGEAKVK